MNTATILLNGDQQEVVSFVPNLTGELAIVDLSVIRRLASLLPMASVNEIKSQLIENIRECRTIESMCTVMRNELAFHESVNIIKVYEPEKMDMSEMR